MYENKWSLMQYQYMYVYMYIYMYCYIWHAQCLSDGKMFYMDYISCGENLKFYLSLLLYYSSMIHDIFYLNFDQAVQMNVFLKWYVEVHVNN